MRLRLFVSTLAMCASLPGLALAADRTTSVSKAPHDLSQPSSVAELHRAVVAAAEQVCRDQGLRGVDALTLRRACVRSAVEAAITDAGEPTLSALFDTLPARHRYSARAYQLSPQAVAAVERAAGRRAVAGL